MGTMEEANWQVKIYRFIAGKTKIIKNLFFLGYIFILAFLLLSIYLIHTQSAFEPVIYGIGKKFGQISLLLLGLIVTPGILGRFRLGIPISRIITAYRRQLGITTFLITFSHFMIVRGAYWLFSILPFAPFSPMFQLFGSLALSIFFLMFITSNNSSVKKLGKWWKRLQGFIYLALWLVFLHVGLQRISIWSIFIFGFATLEVVSLVYDYFMKKR